MSRLLQRPVLHGVPRELLRPTPVLDAFTQSLVDAATKEAYDRGFREGRAAGNAEADARHGASAEAFARATAEQEARIAGGVRAALDGLLPELGRLREAQADGAVGLAQEIAAFVLGREPHDGGIALLARVRDAIAALDDAPLIVRIAPDDADVVRRGLADHPGVDVVADDTLAAGEARVTGRWATAELLHSTAWNAVREVLDATA